MTTGPVDPLRRAAAAASRRTDRKRTTESEGAPDAGALPVPVGKPYTPEEPPLDPTAPADAVFAAQLLGQGQNRGLKGGPQVLTEARGTYLKTEWSGSADRRTKRGGSTKTEV